MEDMNHKLNIFDYSVLSYQQFFSRKYGAHVEVIIEVLVPILSQVVREVGWQLQLQLTRQEHMARHFEIMKNSLNASTTWNKYKTCNK